MTWLSAFEMVALGVFIGVVSNLFITSPRLVRIWAGLVSLVFMLALIAWVIFEYSWMFAAEARQLAQSVVLVSGVAGFFYGTRSRD